METKPGDLEGLAEVSSKAIQKEEEPAPVSKDPASTTAAPTRKDVASSEEVPDPDEDDLDDLDGAYLHVFLLRKKRGHMLTS